MQAMRSRFLPAILFGMLLNMAAPVAAQDIDTVVTTTNRNPSTVADQIGDPAERAAFLRLYQHRDAAEMLRAAKLFLQDFPQSAFLAQAYEVAADSSFDQHEYAAGLDFAKQSLTFLPENPQLLVAVADVQAREHLNDEAVASARAALDYFERFGRPGAIPESEWPATKRRLQASANFALGRALLQEALNAPAGEKRNALLKESQQALSQASTLNPDDWEIVYTLGLARLSSEIFSRPRMPLPACICKKVSSRQRRWSICRRSIRHSLQIPKRISNLSFSAPRGRARRNRNSCRRKNPRWRRKCPRTPGPIPAAHATAGCIGTGRTRACPRCCAPTRPKM